MPCNAARGHHFASLEPPVSPSPQTGSSGARRVSRVVEYRPNVDGDPAGGARRAPGRGLAFVAGYKRIGIVGTSVGSCIGFLAFTHDERFSTGAFIHVSSLFADVVWKGLSTKHVRQSLESATSLDQLRSLWLPISPHPFAERLRGTARKILMVSGRYDPTFLPELSQQIYAELDRCGIPYERVWLPCGHYTMGKFPFSWLAGYQVVRFLSTVKSS